MYYFIFKVKKQCFILCGSSIIPIIIGMIGFSTLVGWIGVFAYISFLYYSISGGGSSPIDEKKEDDVDLESKSLLSVIL